MDLCFDAGFQDLDINKRQYQWYSKIRFIFYSVRTLICQQSPKLTLTGSDKGLVLTASANLMTKITRTSSITTGIVIYL